MLVQNPPVDFINMIFSLSLIPFRLTISHDGADGCAVRSFVGMLVHRVMILQAGGVCAYVSVRVCVVLASYFKRKISP